MISDIERKTEEELEKMTKAELEEHFMKLLLHAKRSGIISVPDLHDLK